jgi:hypothetical protein
MNTHTEIKSIKKASKVGGRTLVFRNAEISDAEFIWSLRTDIKKSKFLMLVSPELGRQVAWLEDYAHKTDQAYFIIETRAGDQLGAVRLYDAEGDNFCWGSWVMRDRAPHSAAIEAALMVYSYATDHLGFRAAHKLEVCKGHRNMCRFHESFGAERVGETEAFYLYHINLEKINVMRSKLKMYLPQNVSVEWL